MRAPRTRTEEAGRAIDALADGLAERARALRDEVVAGDARRLELLAQMTRGPATQTPEAAHAGAAHAAAQLFAYGTLCARWFALREGGGRGLSLLCERLGAGGLAAPMFERVGAAVAGYVSADAIDALVADANLAPCLEGGAASLAHAYERFLAAYDARMRRARGVYFTPVPVAEFVVRRVDRVLRDEFGLERGLAAAKDAMGQPIHVLDPAVGTGAFLAAAVRLVHATIIEDGRRAGTRSEAREQAWRTHVREQLLPRLHGVEVMPAAYVVCHVHLALVLAETGYRLASDDVLDVRLADALRPGVLESGSHDQVRVILTNPPYRRGARAATSTRGDALAVYRVGLEGERNVQPLADDHVRFVRLAETRLAAQPWGVLGMVGNSTFLSGRLYRGMRRSLVDTFDRIDVLDLHGSARVRRTAPGTIRDENVFDVGQGVAIAVMRRLGHAGDAREVRYAELRGSRADKQRRLDASDPPPAVTVRCAAPYFLFVPHDDVPSEYAHAPALDELFSFHSVGAKPGDDAAFVGFDSDDVLRRVERARSALARGETRDPTEAALRLARRPAERPFEAGRVVPYAYRPFDTRAVYDEPEIWTRPVLALRAHLDGQPALLTSRVVKDDTFAHVFATRLLPDVILLSATSSVNCHVFPASCARVDAVEQALGRTVSSRELFAYVYAVLHSPGYRARYASALKLDYPRVPLAREESAFRSLAAAGARLLALHLMEVAPEPDAEPAFVDGGDRQVTRVGEPGARLADLGPGGGRLCINRVSYFAPIPVACWEHRVGGYQVLRKWLLERRRAGRMLTDADIVHFRRVVAIVGHTLELARSIDATVAEHGGWPGAFLARESGGGRLAARQSPPPVNSNITV